MLDQALSGRLLQRRIEKGRQWGEKAWYRAKTEIDRGNAKETACHMPYMIVQHPFDC